MDFSQESPIQGTVSEVNDVVFKLTQWCHFWNALDTVKRTGGHCILETVQGYPATYQRLLYEAVYHASYIEQRLPQDERLLYLVGDLVSPCKRFTLTLMPCSHQLNELSLLDCLVASSDLIDFYLLFSALLQPPCSFQ